MFSRRTSGRFPREQNSEAPGPGSYDLPSTLEKKAPALDARERWSEQSVEGPPGPGNYDPRGCEKGSDAVGAATPTLNLAGIRASLEKENQAPASARHSLSGKVGNGSLSARVPPSSAGVARLHHDARARSPQALASVASMEAFSTTSSAATEAKQRSKDLRLASQLDGVRDELKSKSREAKELRAQLGAKDRRLEELQKKGEELVATRREAHRHTADIEGERDLKRRQLHEKEQELAALQRKAEHLRTAAFVGSFTHAGTVVRTHTHLHCSSTSYGSRYRHAAPPHTAPQH